MNDWDVSEITDFSQLFVSLTTFNEPINNWDVSKGTSFVSNKQSIQFNSICLALFPTLNAKPLHHCCVAFEVTRALNQSCFLLFSHVRRLCLMGSLPLIKTSVVGMSPVEKTL
jgi:hypothetical protein